MKRHLAKLLAEEVKHTTSLCKLHSCGLQKNNKRNQFEPHQPETVEVCVSRGRKIEAPRKEQNVQLSVLNKRGSHLGS